MSNDLQLQILKELRDDVKESRKDINEIKITQVEQAGVLEDHQKASGANSQRLAKLEDEIIPEIVKKLAIKPIEWKKTITWGLVSTITILGIAAKFMDLF